MKNWKITILVTFVIFSLFFILNQDKSRAAGPANPLLTFSINKIEETSNGFMINGSIFADGPHDRESIYDVYSLWVDIIIKNNSNARYPNFKEWAYEPESIAYYYPKAETPYVPGSGPGNTMTKEEAYGINVTTIRLFSASNLGKYNFDGIVPLKYKGKEFRIQATLNWDFTGVNAYWWAHRYFNKIGCEGILGSNYQFLYSDGVEITYPNGIKDNKFSWKSDWPRHGNLSFQFTKKKSYPALWGSSLIGDSSVSGKITKDKIVIRKNASDMPLEFVSIIGQYLITGEGEVSIVPEIYDKNGTLVLRGWGNLTAEIPPEEWENWKEFIQDMTKRVGDYIWIHKIEIVGGIFIKLTTGIPGFVLTMPVKYGAKALGYLSVPPSYGEMEEIKKNNQCI